MTRKFFSLGFSSPAELLVFSLSLLSSQFTDLCQAVADSQEQQNQGDVDQISFKSQLDDNPIVTFNSEHRGSKKDFNQLTFPYAYTNTKNPEFYPMPEGAILSPSSPYAFFDLNPRNKKLTIMNDGDEIRFFAVKGFRNIEKILVLDPKGNSFGFDQAKIVMAKRGDIFDSKKDSTVLQVHSSGYTAISLGNLMLLLDVSLEDLLDIVHTKESLTMESRAPTVKDIIEGMKASNQMADNQRKEKQALNAKLEGVSFKAIDMVDAQSKEISELKNKNQALKDEADKERYRLGQAEIKLSKSLAQNAEIQDELGQAKVELSEVLAQNTKFQDRLVQIKAENAKLQDPDRVANICDITGDEGQDAPGNSPSEASTEKKTPVKII